VHRGDRVRSRKNRAFLGRETLAQRLESRKKEDCTLKGDYGTKKKGVADDGWATLEGKKERTASGGGREDKGRHGYD